MANWWTNLESGCCVWSSLARVVAFADAFRCSAGAGVREIDRKRELRDAICAFKYFFQQSGCPYSPWGHSPLGVTYSWCHIKSMGVFQAQQ